MFRTVKTTLALAAALAATLPMTAFADPHHNSDRSNNGYSSTYNNDRDNDSNYNNSDRDTNNNGYDNNSGYNTNSRHTNRNNNYAYNNNGYGYNNNGSNNNYGYNTNGYRYQNQPVNRQQNKNTWRNLGTAGAAVAVLGLLNHNSAATLLGAAGAAYSANRYEQDRHSQSQQQNNRYGRRSY